MVIKGDSSFTIPDDASVVQPRECGTPEGDSVISCKTGGFPRDCVAGLIKMLMDLGI